MGQDCVIGMELYDEGYDYVMGMGLYDGDGVA